MPPKYTPNAPQAGRYWPGKAPNEEEESSSEEEEDVDEEEEEQQEEDGQRQARLSTRTKVAQVRDESSRITPAAKLITTTKSTSISQQGPYLQPEDESSEPESEEEESSGQTRRPSKIRQASRRAIGGFHADEHLVLKEEDEEVNASPWNNSANCQSSEEESSEEDESSEEYEALPKPILKPVFKAKSERETKSKTNGSNIGLANYGSAPDAETTANGEARRKEEAIKFAEEELRNAARAQLEAELNLDVNRGIEAVDDTDDLDPEAERAAWKLRELQRLKRERETLIARELELEELEKRRNMDEDARLEEDFKRKREIEEEREKTRGSMEFMQKYYHKVAFYQDEEILKKRSYNVPTAEEHRHKEDLPKVLQIRSGELGRASRTKYTHLSAEDTSRGDSPWFDKQNSVNKRTLGRMGGMHDPNDRERKRQRS